VLALKLGCCKDVAPEKVRIGKPCDDMLASSSHGMAESLVEISRSSVCVSVECFDGGAKDGEQRYGVIDGRRRGVVMIKRAIASLYEGTYHV
jgi:hypothetical protein